MHLKSRSRDCLPSGVGCASPAQGSRRVESAAGRNKETKGRELDWGSWGQSHTAGGDSSYLRLYLCGETTVLYPELGAGWRWLAPMPVLKPEYRACPRGKLVPQDSGVFMG